MKLEVLKCPDCGANIEFEEGAESCECEYCGAKITVASSQEPYDTHNAFKNLAKSKNNTSNTFQNGFMGKIIKIILNVFFGMSLLCAGITIIIAITDKDVSMVYFCVFLLIYAVMFKVLAHTPLGSKRIFGKQKGIKIAYFILICFLASILTVMMSPDVSSDTDTATQDGTNVAIVEIVQ